MKNYFSKISLLFSAILFLFSCFVFVFLYKQINSINQKAEMNTIAWQTEALRRNDINLLNNSLAQVSNDRALLETHFAQSSDIVPFLNTIEQLASSAGTKAQVGSVDVGSGNTGLLINLTASGSFQQIYKFLTLLENSPYELDFPSVNISKSTVPDVSSKTINDSNWEATIQVQLLSFEQN
jgi:hypothetical protein